jgi:hypothetical protein
MAGALRFFPPRKLRRRIHGRARGLALTPGSAPATKGAWFSLRILRFRLAGSPHARRHRVPRRTRAFSLSSRAVADRSSTRQSSLRRLAFRFPPLSSGSASSKSPVRSFSFRPSSISANLNTAGALFRHPGTVTGGAHGRQKHTFANASASSALALLHHAAKLREKPLESAPLRCGFSPMLGSGEF